MRETDYQQFKHRIWRLTGQGSPGINRVYERMTELEAEGKTTDEVLQETLRSIHKMIRTLRPLAFDVMGNVERHNRGPA